jgi:hypothetical protein
MITLKEVFPAVLEICPFYKTTWEKHLEYYEEELLYVAVPDMLNRCIDLYENDETKKIDLVFQAVEKLLIEGDNEVRELIEISVLEEFTHIFGDYQKYFIGYLQSNSLKVYKTKSQRLADVAYPKADNYL